MTDIWGYALMRPLWALAIPVIALLGVALARRRRALGAWEAAVDAPLLAALDRLGKVSRGGRRIGWLAPVIAALIALALTGPSKERRDGVAFRNLDGVVIAVDLSRSMIEGGRFADAMTTARLIALSVGTRQVSLVVYGGDAYRASAFTSDAAALGQTIAFLDADTVPDDGSRPERALVLGGRILRDAEIILGDLVLISDGGGLGPEAMAQARALNEAGVPLSTIFVPSRAPQSPPPDRAALDRLAAAGGGAAGDLLDPFPVTRALEQGLERRLRAMEDAVHRRRDYGRFLLLLAVIPALMLFRRRV